MNKLTDRAIEFLVGWEGNKLQPYNDQAGLLTIGIGHLLTAEEKRKKRILINGESVKWADGITNEQSWALKRQDADKFVMAVDKMTDGLDLSDHQFDALVILAFNIGAAGLSGSTVLSRIKRGEPLARIQEAWMLWNKVRVDGAMKVSNGLTKRRMAEYAMYSKADYSGRP